MKKLVYGKGVYDLAPGLSKLKAYSDWKSMLERAYSEKYHLKEPSYRDVEVDKEWLFASNFMEWHNKQRIELRWQLDKDLLIPGNRVYSADTCIYVPAWLNSFTSDRRNDRGHSYIGVRQRAGTGKFEARCNNPFTKKSQYLGVFVYEDDAYNAWLEFKLSAALQLKSKMDEVDLRLYPNVVKIIETKKGK